MFQADRPINKIEQDCLNRSTFAKYLARCMLDHKEPESLVIGLYGGWGVGKTSIINMIVEELNFALTNLENDEKPIILNFSAWSYSGQNQLVYSFFRRLSATIRNVDYLENSEKIVQLLELYVSFFTHQAIPKPFRKKQSIFNRILFKSSNDETHGWEAGRDLTLVKAELNELLKNQKHKFIIIIDNISRLYPEEIKQIFQIVKSMGDFCHTVYLLSLDKKHTVNALNEADKQAGKEYIEKIIQLPFKIPPISNQDMDTLVHSRLQSIVANIPADSWNHDYWADIYYSSIKSFFKNVRDITRYSNILNFSYNRLRDVVNPVDFFALTAIEVFAPELYEGIQENKDLFTDLLQNIYQIDGAHIKNEKDRVQEILSRCPYIPQDTLIILLSNIFPRIKKIYHPDQRFYHSDIKARNEKHICSPDYFDCYFRLSMQKGQIPESEFNTLLKLSSNLDTFNEVLTRLNQDQKIIKFLNLLDNQKVLQSIPHENIQIIISALLNNGDYFPQQTEMIISIDTPKRIHRIILSLLKRIKTHEERFIILQNAITSLNKSLFSAINEIHEAILEHDETSHNYLPPEIRILSNEQLQRLELLMINRIKDWANLGILIDHPRLFDILKAWYAWGESDDLQSYLKSVVQTDRGIISLLESTFEHAINDAMTSYIKQPYWSDCLNDLNILIPVETLESHAKTLFEDEYFDKLREKEQLALIIYLDLMNTETNKTIRQATPD